MGNNNEPCCSSLKNSDMSIEKIFYIIKTKDTSVFKKFTRALINEQTFKKVNSLRIEHEGINTNPLGFCLLLNKVKFYHILREHKASIGQMQIHFEPNDKSPLIYFCSKSFTNVLEIYIPIFLEKVSLIQRLSMANLTFTVPNQDTEFPIHYICRNGNLKVLAFILDYFSNYIEVPAEFQISSKDARGENCALIACRIGSFDLVKYMNETCKANFHLLNDFNENAIIVSISGMNQSKNYTLDYLNIICYLIEVVKIDLKNNYEEALLLSNCIEIIQVLENALKKENIFVTKNELESKYNRIEVNHDPQVHIDCTNFFTKSVVNSIDRHRGSISSIMSTEKSLFSVISFK